MMTKRRYVTTGENGFVLIERPVARPRGFTLIELLVVISIIALLVSILMPSLTKAKELAKAVTCQANQRGLGTAIQLHVSEYGGRLPSSETWIDDILPTLGGSRPDNSFDSRRENMPAALFCPCDGDPFPKPYMTGEMEVTSYMVNGAETDFAMGGGAPIRVGPFGGATSQDDIRSTSACMMLGETTNYGKVVDLDHPAVQQAFTEAGASASNARTRFHHRATSGFFHGDKMNVYYADGHGEQFAGRPVDPLPPGQWPGGALMDPAMAFFPGLSLPTAEDAPAFWGPPCTE
jgi:prepilin-type N-terminal cleavage/methylation domain-containing protein/prepilin-type processing-associated H-X9-DG protein